VYLVSNTLNSVWGPYSIPYSSPSSYRTGRWNIRVSYSMAEAVSNVVQGKSRVSKTRSVFNQLLHLYGCLSACRGQRRLVVHTTSHPSSRPSSFLNRPPSVVSSTLSSHTGWAKKTAPNFSCNNFGKYGPILIMFSLLHSQMN